MEISFLIICIFDLALILHCSVLPICLGELGNNNRNTQSVGLPAETYSNYYLFYFFFIIIAWSKLYQYKYERVQCDNHI